MTIDPTPSDSAPAPAAAALASRNAWQPPGLFLLFFVEMWERFSYYGMRALLVLYLVATLQVPAAVPLANGNETRVDTSATVAVDWTDPGGVVRSTEGTLLAVEGGAMTISTETEEAGRLVRTETSVPAGAATRVEVVEAGNGGRGWSSGDATLLYGWYTGLAYLLPIVGGLIADRFLGTHRSMLVGAVIIAAGHVALAVSGLGSWAHDAAGMSIFVLGLALIVLGTGHFKPCVSVMVGQLYPTADDPRRDGGFSIFYMGINVGAFLAAIVCGLLADAWGWHWGFGAAAVGMLAGLAMYVWGKPRYLAGVGPAPAGAANHTLTFILVSSVLAAGVGYAYHLGAFGAIRSGMNQVVATLGAPLTATLLLAAIGVLVAWLLGVQERADRGKVFAILVFILFNTFFWMAFEQAGSTLNLFAEEKTDRSLALFGGWEMPAAWFQSVNPALIILLAPLFGLAWPWLARRRLEPRQAGKIGIGLILLGIGYVFMVFAGASATDGIRVGIWALMLTYLFHTLGELCLSPTGLSFVTKTAPLRFVSLLMGIWFLSSFAAGVLGGFVGSFVEKIERNEISLPWYEWFRIGGQGDFFFLFVLSSIGAGILCLALGPILNRMSREA